MDTRSYSIKEKNSILGLGHYVLKENHPLFGRTYYTLLLQVAASTEEEAKSIVKPAKIAIEDLMSRLGAKNTAYDYVVATQLADAR